MPTARKEHITMAAMRPLRTLVPMVDEPVVTLANGKMAKEIRKPKMKPKM